MAIVKIIAIRDRLDKRVNYAINGEKTTLDAGITYAVNSEKTKQHFFTSAINCESCETAYAEMQETKRCFGKAGGVVGYHFIQSFAPGEVTPEQAHRIGMAFAEALGLKVDEFLAQDLPEKKKLPRRIAGSRVHNIKKP